MLWIMWVTECTLFFFVLLKSTKKILEKFNSYARYAGVYVKDEKNFGVF